jgi:hypothetical protein
MSGVVQKKPRSSLENRDTFLAEGVISGDLKGLMEKMKHLPKEMALFWVDRRCFKKFRLNEIGPVSKSSEIRNEEVDPERSQSFLSKFQTPVSSQPIWQETLSLAMQSMTQNIIR